MPTIFGKNPRDFKYLKKQQGTLTDAQFMDGMVAGGSKKAVWNYDSSRKNFKSQTDADVSALGLLSNNLEAIMPEIQEVIHEQFRVPEFIPITSKVPEGATSFSYQVIDRYGKGKFINNNGSDVENATVSIRKMIFEIKYAGIMPKWSLQDLRNAQFTGIGLSAETLRAGTEGALDHIQDVAFNGSEEVGFEGLVNNSEIPVYGGTVPNFITADATVVVAFINALIASVGVSSNEAVYERFGKNSLIIALPTEAMDALDRPIGSNSDKTIGEWIANHNTWTTRTGSPVVFKSLFRLNGTIGATQGRIIMYPLSERILEMSIPIMPRVITTDSSSGYETKAPMEYSMGGVAIKYANLMRYADGVTHTP